ncbi:MAG: putative DNA binding domain-containing protein [Candidatus Riflebacteria bacterium]|nr:putative DNA binding domain-containing protein [Candidatus Riflebacteria bacterium]
MNPAGHAPLNEIFDEFELLRRLEVGESRDFEVKAAQGGFPRSFWETYSAFANTDGGTIVLGVSQQNDRFRIDGLEKIAAIEKELWDGLHNRNTVSCNLLSPNDVHSISIEGRTVLVISIPRANRQQRPVFVGKNPFEGTFRRHSEGDHHADRDLIRRMLAEQGDEPVDGRILHGFSLDDIDQTGLQQYRQRLSSRTPTHPFLEYDDRRFLEALGGWRRDRRSGEDGLTAAGLLMFGKWASIRASEAFPKFHLDYREKLADDPDIRWDYRITPDGTWPGNLFSFFFAAIQRLNAHLPLPFQLDGELLRKGETMVHEAVREALVNALIHTDYGGTGGVVIIHTRLGLEFANPGSLLVPLQVITAGGNVSECRNRSLQTMFQLIGGGEKAGSGMAKIFRGWASQQWRRPAIEEMVEPPRVYVRMPFVSLYPPGVLDALKERLGKTFSELSPIEIQALVTAQVEGHVSNVRLQEIVADHPTDITRILQSLVTRGLLRQVGSKRGAQYLPIGSNGQEIFSNGGLESQHKEQTLPDSERARQHKDETCLHNDTTCQHKDEACLHNDATCPHKDVIYQHSGIKDGGEENLLAIARPAVDKLRLSPADLAEIIVRLCLTRELRLDELASLVKRHPIHIRDRYLKPLIDAKIIHRRFPDRPKAPDQLYLCEKIPEPGIIQNIFERQKL